MKYIEKIDNLFNYENNYYLAQCISADSGHDKRAMRKGIVVEFNNRYDMKNKMLDYGKHNTITVGDCIVIDKVFNLITKPVYYSKPTYQSFEKSILNMKKFCVEYDVKKLALPILGCGIDKLEWDKVREIIKNIFNDIDIEIIVCFYNQTEWNKWH